MNIAIVSECAMAKTHGTGAILLRVFHEADVAFTHLYLQDSGFGPSECPNSHLVFHLPHCSYRYQLLAHRFLRIIGRSLWKKNKLNPRMFAQFCRKNNIRADVAYVVVSHEGHAQRFNAILEELKCPYVVHVMDIYHELGLNPKTMPGFRTLLSKSRTNLALTDAIRDEMAKFDDRPIDIISVGQNRNPFQTLPPEKNKPVVIVMIGRPYRRGTELLGKAWVQIADRIGQVEVLYLGAHADALPAAVKPFVRNGGYVTDHHQLSRMMASAHLAFLSGPSELDCFGKFSFPSRCSDYLMAGLPVIASVAEGSATERFLQPLSPGCVRFARSDEEIVKAIEDLTTTPERWSLASKQARAYAQEHLAIEKIREQILCLLHSASRLRQPASILNGAR